MTVIRVQEYKKCFIGHSSDAKPTDVNDGAEFHVIDTGEEYVFFDGMWVQDLRKINAIKMAAL
jgi:hypothetical protein